MGFEIWFPDPGFFPPPPIQACPRPDAPVPYRTAPMRSRPALTPAFRRFYWPWNIYLVIFSQLRARNFLEVIHKMGSGQVSNVPEDTQRSHCGRGRPPTRPFSRALPEFTSLVTHARWGRCTSLAFPSFPPPLLSVPKSSSHSVIHPPASFSLYSAFPLCPRFLRWRSTSWCPRSRIPNTSTVVPRG